MARRHRKRDPSGLCETPAMRTDVTPTTCRFGAVQRPSLLAFGVDVRARVSICVCSNGGWRRGGGRGACVRRNDGASVPSAPAQTWNRAGPDPRALGDSPRVPASQPVAHHQSSHRISRVGPRRQGNARAVAPSCRRLRCSVAPFGVPGRRVTRIGGWFGVGLLARWMGITQRHVSVAGPARPYLASHEPPQVSRVAHPRRLSSPAAERGDR